jgi:hypothetical protein
MLFPCLSSEKALAAELLTGYWPRRAPVSDAVRAGPGRALGGVPLPSKPGDDSMVLERARK